MRSNWPVTNTSRSHILDSYPKNILLTIGYLAAIWISRANFLQLQSESMTEIVCCGQCERAALDADLPDRETHFLSYKSVYTFFSRNSIDCDFCRAKNDAGSQAF